MGAFKRGRNPLLLLVLLVAAFLTTAGVGRRGIELPTAWGTAILEHTTRDWSVSLRAERMKWHPWTEVVLYGVEVPEVGLRVERAHIALTVADLVSRDSGARRVRVVRATWEGAGLPIFEADVESAPVFIESADVEWRGDRVVLHDVRFNGWGGQGIAQGEVTWHSPAPEFPDDGGERLAPVPVLNVAIAFNRWDVAAARRWLGAFGTGLGAALREGLDGWRGAIEGGLTLRGPAAAPEVEWSAEARDLLWERSPWHPHPYRIVSARAFGRLQADGSVVVEQATADVVPRAGGEGGGSGELHRRLELSGTITPGGQLNVRLRATGLRLEEDVPHLTVWGMSGTGEFEGTLQGNFRRPQLAGDLTLQAGTLWGQPIDKATGAISLDREAFTVTGSVIERGEARYHLDGTLLFAADGREAEVNMTVRAERGQAETLLDVLRWDDVPLYGIVDGILQFAGPVSAVTSQGDLQITAGRGWQQAFDEVSGSYRWDGSQLQLVDGVFRLEGGWGVFRGVVGRDGAVDLDVEATGLPLESMEAVRRASRGLVRGRVDFRGRLTGQLNDPHWTGEVVGRRLQVGPLSFETAAGGVGLERGAWEIRDWELIRPGGARYSAAGWVHAAGGLPPLMHLLVDVRDETLEETLSLLGIRLAYPLASGRVAGRALITGDLSQPDGEISLSVTEAELMGRPTGLAVEMELAGGQVRVKHLQLGPQEASRQRPSISKESDQIR